MAFSQEFIEKVREASNLVDEVSQFTELKRAGSQLTGLCPFPSHNEKTASFSVSESKQVYHCFGCKKSGNIFNFLQELRGFNFPEAIEYLAQKASIPIPIEDNTKPFSSESKNAKKTLLAINKMAGEYYHLQLKKHYSNPAIQQFLSSRGLTKDIIKTFHLGFSTSSWSGLLDHLRSRGVSLKLIEQLGLIKKSKKTGDYFDLYRERIMFPILNPMGDWIGFGGRVLDQSLPKYINSSESEIFNKSKTLYGLDETAKHIRTKDEAIIVEGYMDHIALYKSGIKNAVATLGTALTPSHAKMLKRLCKKVIVLFDGDSAGRSAAERSLSILLSEGLLVHGLFLPNKVDPDDFINENGKDALIQKIESAPDLFYLIIDAYLTDYSGQPSEQVTILRKTVPILSTVSDPVLFDIYKNEVSQRLKLDPQTINKAIASYKKERQRGLSNHPSPSSPPLPTQNKANNFKYIDKVVVKNPPPAEKLLLNIALMKSSYFTQILESGILEHFSHQEVRKIFSKAEQTYRQMPNKFDNLTALLGSYVEPQNLLTMQFGPPLLNAQEEDVQKMIVDCQQKIKEVTLKNLVEKTKAKFGKTDGSDQLQELERIMNIYKDKHNLRNQKKPQS
ncbi:MAG: DNA primase [Bdellovibrionales bacterium]|nr:DNA primase [Bdellovibrionales bacterium]